MSMILYDIVMITTVIIAFCGVLCIALMIPFIAQMIFEMYRDEYRRFIIKRRNTKLLNMLEEKDAKRKNTP